MALVIDDPADPRVAPYHAIQERQLVLREGRFIAEGLLVVEQLLASSLYSAESILVAEPMRARLPQTDVPVYVAAQAVLDAIAGFPIHRGVLALGVRREVPREAVFRGAKTLLFAVGVANHDNIGALFRNAAGLGADGILLDPTCADPLYRKSIRVSMGAVLRVPHVRLPADEAFAELRGFETWALAPEAEERLGDRVRRGLPDRLCLLVGAEGEGLPPGIEARADHRLTIEMARGTDSLNVATAAAITLAFVADARTLVR